MTNRTFINRICIYACLAIFSFTATGCEQEAKVEDLRPQVRYQVVEGHSITLTRELPGRVSAFRVSEVRPQVNGIIQERLFEEGADVVAGQVLYQIDPSIYQAAYNNAKARLARAEASLVTVSLRADRYRQLVQVGAVGRQEYDDAVAAHRQAQAEVAAAQEDLETANINLGYTKITAPVSGRIGRSLVTPGTLVTHSQPNPLAVIQQINNVYVDVTQSNTELLKLRRDLASGRLVSGGINSARVTLLLEDGSPYTRNALQDNASGQDWIEGALLFSDVTIEQSTGVVTIRAAFENSDNVLLPGMYVRAVLEEGVRNNAVLVPQKAVVRDARGRAVVYVLNQHEQPGSYSVEVRDVDLERDYQQNWLITSGLQMGDMVLIDGQQKVRPGQLVAGVKVDTSEILDVQRFHAAGR